MRCFFFCLFASVESEVTEWTLMTTPPLPYGRTKGAISGFDSINNRIVHVGGWATSWRRWVYTLNVNNTNNFTFSTYPDISHDLACASQSYTVVDSTIYYEFQGQLGQFNMLTLTDKYPWNDIHVNPTKDICVTSDHSNYLFLLGAPVMFAIYNLSSNNFTTNGPNLSPDRWGFTCEFINNKIVIFGGQNSQSHGFGPTKYNSVQTINASDINILSSKLWIDVTNLSISSSYLRSAVVNDFVYIGHGEIKGSTTVNGSNVVDIYNSIDDSITMSNILTNNIVSDMSTIYALGRLYTFGGWTYKSPVTTDTWEVSNQLTLTNTPSETPTNMPTLTPTNIPTNHPTDIPTEIPSDIPTNSPIIFSASPTILPSEMTYPTHFPTHFPTTLPVSNMPTASPSENVQVTDIMDNNLIIGGIIALSVVLCVIILMVIGICALIRRNKLLKVQQSNKHKKVKSIESISTVDGEIGSDIPMSNIAVVGGEMTDVTPGEFDTNVKPRKSSNSEELYDDALSVPTVGNTLGDDDIHDINLDTTKGETQSTPFTPYDQHSDDI